MELIHLNRYVHDFTSAMWVCGSILLWMVCREWGRTGVQSDVSAVLARLVHSIRYLTVPALIITLASGGVRAATFVRYEHVGEVLLWCCSWRNTRNLPCL